MKTRNDVEVREHSDPDPVNTCVNTFRRRKAKKKPPGLRNLSGFNQLAGRR